MNYKGRHKKSTDSSAARKIAFGASIVVGGAVIPATFAGSASAAPVSVWDKIAQCESSGRWDIDYGDGGASVHGGGLQFQPASWGDALAQLHKDGIDTSKFGQWASTSTKNQQILAGEALLKIQGPSAWACNSMTGYPLNGYSGGDYAPYLDAPAPVDPPKTDPPAETPPEGGPSTSGTYTVVEGDYLVKIAREQKVPGGWKALYAANRKTVGDNPNLIYPGQVLDLPVASDPYEGSGLPRPNRKSPSAVALQKELKRVGYMAGDVVENANYGPLTQASVAGFHDAHPDFRSLGVAHDVAIGPKGWKFLRAMKDGAGKVSAPARTLPAPAPATGAYAAPVVGYPVTQVFHNPGNYGTGWHTGVDITAPSGTPVHAAAAGTVIVGGAGAAYGNHVVIDHGNGVFTLYGHMSRIAVSSGQHVSAGDVIGAVGMTGNATGPHLHFELRNSATAYGPGVFSDPVAWLRSHGVNL